MILQFSHFFLPFIPLHLAHPLPPTFPHLSSCPWVIHISSLASPFPILFLTSPCLFWSYHLCFLFPVPFPPFSSSPSPLITLHVISVSVILVCSSCLLSLFLFLFQVWLLIAVSLLSFQCSYFLFSFSQISPFNISYNKGLVMMNCFNLTLPGKHFICPSILNDSFAGYSNLGCRSLPFMTWNTSFHSLLASKVCFEESADSLMGILCR